MAKTIFEEMGGTYARQGDYLLPCLFLPAEKENKPIGVWGQRHLRYLKQHRKVLYTNLLTSGKLNSYLADIDEQADDLFFRLVNQMVEREGVTSGQIATALASRGLSPLWTPKRILCVKEAPLLGSGKFDYRAAREMVLAEGPRR